MTELFEVLSRALVLAALFYLLFKLIWERRTKHCHYNDLSEARLYTYNPDTKIPKRTYADKNKTIIHTNPIVLDEGRANVYLDDGGYRFVVENDGGIIWTGETE